LNWKENGLSIDIFIWAGGFSLIAIAIFHELEQCDFENFEPLNLS
jgi:hypothetical protein